MHNHAPPGPCCAAVVRTPQPHKGTTLSFLSSSHTDCALLKVRPLREGQLAAPSGESLRARSCFRQLNRICPICRTEYRVAPVPVQEKASS